MTDDDKICHGFTNQPGIILGFPQILLAEAGAGEPCRRDVEEIRKAARGCVMI